MRARFKEIFFNSEKNLKKQSLFLENNFEKQYGKFKLTKIPITKLDEALIKNKNVEHLEDIVKSTDSAFNNQTNTATLPNRRSITIRLIYRRR